MGSYRVFEFRVLTPSKWFIQGVIWGLGFRVGGLNSLRGVV